MQGTDFHKYLERREADLLRFHPQFFHTNDEIEKCEDLLKRDSTPICIPPSWDLVQKYAGALDKNADGYDKDLYEMGKRNYVGDQGEAEFFDIVRNLKIGGILIGDVNSQHLLYGHQLKNGRKEDFMLPNQIIKPLKKAKDFQFDFLYFDPQIGLIHIETKRSKIYNQEIMLNNFEQIGEQRKSLKEIFEIFCKCIGNENSTESWPILSDSQTLRIHSSCSDGEQSAICDNENIISCHMNDFEQLLQHLRLSRMQHNVSRNIFKGEIFRQFIIFLSGYRPNFFISPVQCTLQIWGNITRHEVNALNCYQKGKGKGGVQIKAETVVDYLKSLKLKNPNIVFEKHKHIYLTEQQMNAIGNFDEAGNLFPKKQLIFGPAGSGKSLIAMIKIFILGQLENRLARKLIYATRFGEYLLLADSPHGRNVQKFVADNSNAFCRDVEYRYEWNLNQTRKKMLVDLVFDEVIHVAGLLFEEGKPFFSDFDAIISIIVTGENANKWNATSDDDWQLLRDFSIVNLSTVFRSTRQIQKFATQFLSDRNPAAFPVGHNYEGVKVELYTLCNIDQLHQLLSDRLIKLIEHEKCDCNDIGVFNEDANINSWLSKTYPDIQLFYVVPKLKSMEFPVMIVVEPSAKSFYFLCSRSIAHLIVLEIPERRARKTMFKELLRKIQTNPAVSEWIGTTFNELLRKIQTDPAAPELFGTTFKELLRKIQTDPAAPELFGTTFKELLRKIQTDPAGPELFRTTSEELLRKIQTEPAVPELFGTTFKELLRKIQTDPAAPELFGTTFKELLRKIQTDPAGPELFRTTSEELLRKIQTEPAVPELFGTTFKELLRKIQTDPAAPELFGTTFKELLRKIQTEPVVSEWFGMTSDELLRKIQTDPAAPELFGTTFKELLRKIQTNPVVFEWIGTLANPMTPRPVSPLPLDR